MKKIRWIGLFVCLTLLLSACKKPEPIYNNELRKLPVVSAEWVDDSWAIPYPVREQDTLHSLPYPTYREIEAAGAVSVLRCHEGRYYSVSRISDGSYLFILYDKIPEDTDPKEIPDLLVIVDGLRVKKLLPYEAQRFIRLFFTPKSAIPLWDANGYYPDEPLGDTPVSYHRFSDRSTMMILSDLNEDGEWVITFAGALPESGESVLEYMSDADLALIS